MSRCPYKIRFGISPDTTVQCTKRAHVPPDLDLQHEALASNGITKITWEMGDRRQFTGDWPGYCTKIDKPPFMGGCVLPQGHPRKCAT